MFKLLLLFAIIYALYIGAIMFVDLVFRPWIERVQAEKLNKGE